MKKLILMGRSGCGKTSLSQALRGESLHYEKTQYIDYGDFLIDTPGEYAENSDLGRALALYSYEADVVGLLISADDSYSLFPPNITCLTNREVIGIVTKTDSPDANAERAQRWLKLSGCEKVFFTSAKLKKGINEVLDYISESKKPTKNNKIK